MSAVLPHSVATKGARHTVERTMVPFPHGFEHNRAVRRFPPTLNSCMVRDFCGGGRRKGGRGVRTAGWRVVEATTKGSFHSAARCTSTSRTP